MSGEGPVLREYAWCSGSEGAIACVGGDIPKYMIGTEVRADSLSD